MNRARAALAEFGANPADIDHVFREACRDVVDQVGVVRAGIWFFNLAGDCLTCECLYDRRTDEFIIGTVLAECDYPDYFAALRRELRVVADDAERHPATAAFADTYLRPNGIRALLDHVVRAGDVPVAVLCCEDAAADRRWTRDDELYLQQMAVLLGIVFKARLDQMTGRCRGAAPAQAE